MNKDFCYNLHHCTEMMATVVKLMAEKMKSHLQVSYSLWFHYCIANFQTDQAAFSVQAYPGIYENKNLNTTYTYQFRGNKISPCMCSLSCQTRATNEYTKFKILSQKKKIATGAVKREQSRYAEMEHCFLRGTKLLAEQVFHFLVNSANTRWQLGQKKMKKRGKVAWPSWSGRVGFGRVDRTP